MPAVADRGELNGLPARVSSVLYEGARWRVAWRGRTAGAAGPAPQPLDPGCEVMVTFPLRGTMILEGTQRTWAWT